MMYDLPIYTTTYTYNPLLLIFHIQYALPKILFPEPLSHFVEGSTPGLTITKPMKVFFIFWNISLTHTYMFLVVQFKVITLQVRNAFGNGNIHIFIITIG